VAYLAQSGLEHDCSIVRVLTVNESRSVLIDHLIVEDGLLVPLAAAGYTCGTSPVIPP